MKNTDTFKLVKVPGASNRKPEIVENLHDSGLSAVFETQALTLEEQYEIAPTTTLLIEKEKHKGYYNPPEKIGLALTLEEQAGKIYDAAVKKENILVGGVAEDLPEKNGPYTRKVTEISPYSPYFKPGTLQIK